MEYITNFYSKWNHLPWKVWTSPAERWKEMPTFVIGEYIVYSFALINLLHAIKNRKQGNLTLWFASFLAGSANDIFFMALPLVDNFWQAQATIMITPRLPLYICCIYNCFMYTSVAASWKLAGKSKLCNSLIAGILAWLIYGPYDIIGAKFLWWTWHETDPPVAARLFGAPIGSTLWILTFTATFAFIMTVMRQCRPKSAVKLLWGPLTILAACFSTPVMMVEMALTQLLSGDAQGKPTERSLIFVVCLYLAAIVYFKFLKIQTGRQNDKIPPTTIFDIIFNFAILIYCLILNMIIITADPITHINTGVHQTIGPCDEIQNDFSGQTRLKYVCNERTVSEDWTLNCTQFSTNNRNSYEWYSVCGLPYTNFLSYVGMVFAITFTSTIVYSIIIQGGGKTSGLESSPAKSKSGRLSKKKKL